MNIVEIESHVNRCGGCYIIPDLSEDHRWPERSFAGVVGIGHVAAGDEAEQIVPIAAHGLEQA